MISSVKCFNNKPIFILGSNLRCLKVQIKIPELAMKYYMDNAATLFNHLMTPVCYTNRYPASLYIQ